MAADAPTPEALLRRQLEEAVRAGRSKAFLLPQLERLVSIAPEGSEPWRFANRQLAELLLEQAPWRAALHARRVAINSPSDDAAHALLGLALALQTNYRAAIASYRRALAANPNNPWYAHNVGHLYDVALDLPRDGLAFLRLAHREEPSQDDVTASLAHCLARSGSLGEAKELATELAARRPERADFADLARWIADGALDRPVIAAPALLASIEHGATAAEPVASEQDSIEVLLDRAPLTDEQRERARRLWVDFESRGAREGSSPGRALAAAIEYAIHRVDGGNVTQRALAERYGVSVSAIRSRYSAIRAALAPELEIGRYRR
jgi:tetratricopeptide (TPR) repeat protein